MIFKDINGNNKGLFNRLSGVIFEGRLGGGTLIITIAVCAIITYVTLRTFISFEWSPMMSVIIALVFSFIVTLMSRMWTRMYAVVYAGTCAFFLILQVAAIRFNSEGVEGMYGLKGIYDGNTLILIAMIPFTIIWLIFKIVTYYPSPDRIAMRKYEKERNRRRNR